LPNSSTAMAKFSAWASRSKNVVMPMALPEASNRPPPDEPGEIGAEV